MLREAKKRLLEILKGKETLKEEETMLREAKELLVEIPNTREVYAEVIKLREAISEIDYEESGYWKMIESFPKTQYLYQWLETIEQQKSDINVPQNLEEEKICIVRNIAYNMIESIGCLKMDNYFAAALEFKPSEELMKELKEKGYWVQEVVVSEEYYIHTLIPEEYWHELPMGRKQIF